MGRRAEMEPRFPRIFAPRSGSAPAMGGTIGTSARGVGAKWTLPGACALVLSRRSGSGCPCRACAAERPWGRWLFLRYFPGPGGVCARRRRSGWAPSQYCLVKEGNGTLLPAEIYANTVQ